LLRTISQRTLGGSYAGIRQQKGQAAQAHEGLALSASAALSIWMFLASLFNDEFVRALMFLLLSYGLIWLGWNMILLGVRFSEWVFIKSLLPMA
jgi:hypothetical protein